MDIILGDKLLFDNRTVYPVFSTNRRNQDPDDLYGLILKSIDRQQFNNRSKGQFDNDQPIQDNLLISEPITYS